MSRHIRGTVPWLRSRVRALEREVSDGRLRIRGLAETANEDGRRAQTMTSTIKSQAAEIRKLMEQVDAANNVVDRKHEQILGLQAELEHVSSRQVPGLLITPVDEPMAWAQYREARDAGDDEVAESWWGLLVALHGQEEIAMSSDTHRIQCSGCGLVAEVTTADAGGLSREEVRLRLHLRGWGCEPRGIVDLCPDCEAKRMRREMPSEEGER